MRRLEVLEGQMFGRLQIVSEASISAGHRRFVCLCACGVTVTVHLSSLRTKISTSCGCWRKERATIHGGHRTAEYQAWEGMIRRCSAKLGKNWNNYGARGISVCEEWRSSFPAFLSHVGRRPTPRYSIDRWPNNNGNYEPGNVRWATMRQQLRNTRRNPAVSIADSPVLLI